MSRLALLAVISLPAVACTPSHDPVPLASMTRTSVELTTSKDSVVIDAGYTSPAVALSLRTKQLGSDGDPADCPTISGDASVTYDGLAMALVDEGGWDGSIDGQYCHDIAFALAQAPSRPGEISQLVIQRRQRDVDDRGQGSVDE